MIAKIKNTPILLSCLMGFMFGFIIATILYKLGIMDPPAEITQIIEGWSKDYPMLFLISIIVCLASLVAWIIVSVVKAVISLVKGIIEIRQDRVVTKQLEHLEKYGYIR